MSTRVDAAAAPIGTESAAGVIGNARITGAFGATIFVLLFIEGITVLRVQELITPHVFVGMLLVPFVLVKVGSTGYRFARYYGGDRPYVEKGAPPLVLRLLGPVVVATTVALLATGIALILTDRRVSWLLPAHKASFILWFGAMTVHVLGHILETPSLAIADLRAAERRRAPRAATRLLLLVLALATGITLGFISLGWVHHWQAVRRF